MLFSVQFNGVGSATVLYENGKLFNDNNSLRESVDSHYRFTGVNIL